MPPFSSPTPPAANERAMRGRHAKPQVSALSLRPYSMAPSKEIVPDMEKPSRAMLEMQARVQADLPKKTGRGRPISRESKIGRYLSDNELRLYAVAANANISPRILTEYCAGRKPFTQQHLLALCRVLDVTPDVLLEDVDEDYEDEVTDLTDQSSSTGGIRQTKTVKDLKREQFGPAPVVSRLRKQAVNE